MTQKELRNVFKYIVKKCDMLINNSNYKADVYTQDIVEDIAELCNHILDGDYGKLVEVKEVDLEKVIEEYFKGWTDDYDNGGAACHYQYVQVNDCKAIAKHFFELGLKAQKGK